MAAQTAFARPVGSNGSGNLCGPDNGVPSVSSPVVSGLCMTGDYREQRVTNNGGGQWNWTCQSGSNTINCAANILSSTPGACGSANGTSDWLPPNVDLFSETRPP